MGHVRKKQLRLRDFLSIAVAMAVATPLMVSSSFAWTRIDQIACGDRHYLREIQKRFNWSQRNTFKRDITLLEFLDVRQAAFRANDPAFQDRIHCHGKVLLSNGRKHSLFYKLSSDGGPPLGAKLQWCVIGYDDYRAFAPACRQLKPL